MLKQRGNLGGIANKPGVSLPYVGVVLMLSEWVDFSYSVNGKMYDFSLPGGGFVSFTNLIEVLGIIEGTNSGENDIDSAEVTDQDALTLSDVTVSEETKKFVADVESIEFSNPELVWVGKVETDSTVGGIKEANGLEVQYSAELTEEQIEEINAQTVESGDWALISMLPFLSEESLTVTMKTGEVFTIKVTDAQITKTVIDAKGDTWEITVTYGEDAGIPDGADLKVEELLPETEDYQKYLTDSAKELSVEDSKVSFARFFDIIIVDENGEKVEPKVPVQVEIKYKDAMELGGDQTLSIVHFAEDGTEVIRPTISEDGKEISYTQSSFSITGTIVTTPSSGSQYMVLVKRTEQDENGNSVDRYYVTNSDGSLSLVRYENGKVYVDNPMLWTYTGTNLYHPSIQVGFNSSQIASDFFYRYIDPSVEDGISDEDESNTSVNNDSSHDGPYVTSRPLMTQSALTYNNGKLQSTQNGNYYVGVSEAADGTLSLCGQSSSSDAAEIIFASATEVESPTYLHHAVNHIDISISGTTSLEVPLAYGKYYDEDGNEILTVTSNKNIEVTKSVGITTDDMKNATIVAYTRNADGSANYLDDCFYINEYSANESTDYSTDQVRIGGSFKVANLDWDVKGDLYNGYWGEPYNSGRPTWHDADQNYINWVHQQRLANKIYYSVTAIKTITFDLVDPELGQLYDAYGNKLTITLDVALTASFNYFDAANECPPVQWDLTNVLNGLICTHDMSGMDFVLGGDAEDAESNIVAVEITKMIVDENGNRIKPDSSQTITNTFSIWQDADGNPNSVVGLDIDEYTRAADYEGYVNLHSKNIKVGPDGMGLVYDYDVTPGMFYIRENQDSIPNEITDTDGETWTYVGTRIETESLWRDTPAYDGHMHVSDTYTKDTEDSTSDFNSIPEVLGNYNDIKGNTTWTDEDGEVHPIRNGFLEFYVYNIYKPETTDLTVRKNWENGSAPDGSSVDVVIKRYKLVADGSVTPPEPTSAALTITDSYSGLSGERTYSASYRVTGPDGYDQTFSWTGSSITIPDLPFGEYTVAKTATAQDGYDAENLTESQTVTLGVSGASVTFAGTTYTRQSSEDTYHHVLIYANDISNMGAATQAGLTIASNGYPAWVDADYIEGTALTFTVGVPAWNNNSTYSYSINGTTPVTIPQGETKKRV